MKRIKEFFREKYSLSVATVLSALGFSFYACVAYGTPSAEFAIRGKVTATVSGEAIEGIQVIREGRYSYENDTVYTDVNGMYHISGGYDFVDSMNVAFIDIDGLENGGEFSSKTEPIRFQSGDFKGGDGDWDHGKATKELNVNLELKK